MVSGSAKLLVCTAFLWMVTTTSQVIDRGSEFPEGVSSAEPSRSPASISAPPGGAGRVLIRTEEISIYDIYKMTRHFALSYNGGRFSCRTSGLPQHEVKVRNLSSLRSPVIGHEVPKGCRSVVQWGGERFCQDGARNPVVRDLLDACRRN